MRDRYPGFTTEEYRPGDHTLEVAGEFEFRVTINDEDWEGNPRHPCITVALPHQCDAWEIVDGVAAKNIDGAISTMQIFVREAQAALDVLRKMKDFDIPSREDETP